jgi:prophage maintenance system killer protein
MIPLGMADLVLIAGRVLDLDTDEVLDLLDVAAAETALAEAAPDVPARAAALLYALLRRSPLARGNEQVALMATAQFLAVNGFQLDLDPPDATLALIVDLAAGRLGPADAAQWLAPRLRPRADTDPVPSTERPALLRWLLRRRRSGPFHRFTDRARVVVVLAQDEARQLGHGYIGTEHLLLGLLREGGGIAAVVLEMLGISGPAARREVEKQLGRDQPAPSGHIPFTAAAKDVLDRALREAMQLGHGYVGTEHLLLGLRDGTGRAAAVLVGFGATRDRVRELVLEVLTGPHAGRRAEPPEIAHYTELITAVRRDKQAAIDTGDFPTAVRLRDTEKRLLIEKQRLLDLGLPSSGQR